MDGASWSIAKTSFRIVETWNPVGRWMALEWCGRVFAAVRGPRNSSILSDVVVCSVLLAPTVECRNLHLLQPPVCLHCLASPLSRGLWGLMADASDDCRVFPTYRSSCRRFPTYLGRGRDDDDETHTKRGRDALLGRSVLGREASAGSSQTTRSLHTIVQYAVYAWPPGEVWAVDAPTGELFAAAIGALSQLYWWPTCSIGARPV